MEPREAVLRFGSEPIRAWRGELASPAAFERRRSLGRGIRRLRP